MKRLLALALATSLVVAAVAFSGGRNPNGLGLVVQVEERNPWTHLRLNNNIEEFRFAIVSDRTGGHRARIFSQAVERLNLMQPEFVLSVGDLIEGNKDLKKTAVEWKEFDSFVNKLQMPFFYVPGNHDLSNMPMRDDWHERYGRRYYHFLYRDVLFLILDSEDPPGGGGSIRAEQIQFAEKVLKENASPRWTIVIVHKPLWNTGKGAKNGWLDVEKLLDGRKYTVFCGHVHRYQKFVRNGMNYYQLATTGGSSKMRGVKYGEFDHIVWITMKREGPVLANIMLDGIYPESMEPIVTDEKGNPAPKRLETHAVQGKVILDGKPVADAQVVFHPIADKKKAGPVAEGYTNDKGMFLLTTYLTNDGAAAGEYTVTAIRRDPQRDEQGKPGPNRLPAQYADPAKSPLRATVRPGPNEFLFNLQD